jgi:transposase InsO family protein
MKQILDIVGISHQGYYKSKKQEGNKQLREEMVLELVQSLRRKMPKLGGKKLYHMISSDLETMGIKLGRDKFFKLLSKHGLLIHRKKRYKKTTNSSHRFKIYKNLIKDLEPAHRNKVWVSDITYIIVEDSFCYLSLITDL